MAAVTNQVKEKDLEDVETEVTELQDYIDDTQEIHDKLIELEDRSRRNNLRFEGIEETESETWEEFDEKVQAPIQEQLGMERVEMNRTHRAGREDQNREYMCVDFSNTRFFYSDMVKHEFRITSYELGVTSY